MVLFEFSIIGVVCLLVDYSTSALDTENHYSKLQISSSGESLNYRKIPEGLEPPKPSGYASTVGHFPHDKTNAAEYRDETGAVGGYYINPSPLADQIGVHPSNGDTSLEAKIATRNAVPSPSMLKYTVAAGKSHPSPHADGYEDQARNYETHADDHERAVANNAHVADSNAYAQERAVANDARVADSDAYARERAIVNNAHVADSNAYAQERAVANDARIALSHLVRYGISSAHSRPSRHADGYEDNAKAHEKAIENHARVANSDAGLDAKITAAKPYPSRHADRARNYENHADDHERADAKHKRYMEDIHASLRERMNAASKRIHDSQAYNNFQADKNHARDVRIAEDAKINEAKSRPPRHADDHKDQARNYGKPLMCPVQREFNPKACPRGGQ